LIISGRLLFVRLVGSSSRFLLGRYHQSGLHRFSLFLGSLFHGRSGHH